MELRLSESFLRKYMFKQPKWGFDGLGYIVYLRTYARKKPDGSLEEWWETCRRVVEGNFNIEAERLKELGKWTPEKKEELQKEMERFYHLMFNLAMTPPGRGLWMSGTDYEKRSGDALNNCFRAGTRVHTDKGVFPIEQLVGQTVNVLSQDGKYRPAEFHSFGEQPLMRVEFSNGDVVYATPNHEWLVVDSKGKIKKERVYTSDLKPGMRVPLVLPPDVEADEEGIVHGFVFGDGWYNAATKEVEVKLFGKKQELLPLLEKYARAVSWVVFKDEKVPYVRGFPLHFKELPKGVTREYAKGFILGLIAADGNVRGSVRIHNKDEQTLQAIRDLALYAGFATASIYLDREVSPFDGSEKPVYCLTLRQFSFKPDDFVLQHQRESFKVARRNVRTVAVRHVEETNLVEEVYCCIEPETHTVVIEGGILTGQCWLIAMRPQCFNGETEPSPAFAACFTFDQAMKGGGVGVNIQRKNTEQMPVVKNKVRVDFVCSALHKDYKELEELDQKENVKVKFYNPNDPISIPGKYLMVGDSREGWCEALRLVIEAHHNGTERLIIDISKVRPRGSEIKGFGGIASGPAPLVVMLNRVNNIMNNFVGKKLTPTAWGDIIQNIGCCVVAGNVRRTALILIGDEDEHEFIQSKNYSLPQNKGADRWRWASNNSVDISPNTSRETLRKLAENIYYNGEPGYVSISLAQNYGRIIDGYQPGIDGEVEGFNPCGEISLPNASPCNLFEINLVRIHEMIESGEEDESLYEEVARLAARYAYRVTFRPYEWEATRRIVEKHRRLGVGITGITDWILLRFGERAIKGFDENGNPIYNEKVTRELDRLYKAVRKANKEQAKELEANESIKVTTVKPSGTVSILMGVSPGQHFHWSAYMIRRVRMAAHSPLVEVLRECGYNIEYAIMGYDDNNNPVYDTNTVVVEFPVKAPTADHPLFQSAEDVPLEEQAAIQAMLQTYWSDNAVSATLTFHKPDPKPVFFEDGTQLLDKFGNPVLHVDPRDEEKVIEQITDILDRYKTVIKSTTLLPHSKGTYPQMPYEKITKEQYEEMISRIKAKPWEVLMSKKGYSALADEEVDTSMECAGGACPIR